MTDDEIQGLKDVQRGSPTVQAAEALRKFTGSMTGNLFEAGLGGLEAAQHFGPIGGLAAVAAPYVANKVATGVGNSASRGAMNALDQTLRMRSPLFNEWVASGKSAAPSAVPKLAAALVGRAVSPVVPQLRYAPALANPPSSN
jgi:hypothetical protein